MSRILGIGSWYSDLLVHVEGLESRICFGTYGARYLDGWVVTRSKH